MHNAERKALGQPEQDPAAIVQAYIRLLTEYNQVKDSAQVLFDKVSLMESRRLIKTAYCSAVLCGRLQTSNSFLPERYTNDMGFLSATDTRNKTHTQHKRGSMYGLHT